MKAVTRAFLGVLSVVLLTGPAAAGTLKIDIRNGLVTLEAQEVTVREILAEWARIGRTRIENREQVGGAAVTLTLKDVPEKDALAILLRSVSGYIAAPRQTPMADASIYDVVYVLATMRPTTTQGTSATSQAQQLLRGGRAGAQGPSMGMRPAMAVDDTADDAMPPIMRPGFVTEQMIGGPGGTPVQLQISPGILAPTTMGAPAQAGQTGQAPQSTTTPAGTTAIGSATPGALPPSASGTTAKPIKPPGGPVSRP
jgi:hypothetical protein